MKILINTSNLYVGGGLQVAISFLNEIKDIESKNIYHVFLSTAVSEQIVKNEFSNRFIFYEIPYSAAPLYTRKKSIERLDMLENIISPDIVFSIFGPTYWRPKTKHLMGFALGWMVSSTPIVYKQLPFIKRIKMKMISQYKKYYTKRDADFYVVEAEDVKLKLSKVAKLNLNAISVIGNTHSSVFNSEIFSYFHLPEKKHKEFRLVTISHNYPHKNLQIIRNVIPLLYNKNIRFYLTIDELSYKTLFSGLEDVVINLGSVKSVDCPSIYQQCDALFLPTLLECFSASYPEAMKMEKPILTSDYSFAQDICKDAAIYFNALDPQDIATKILDLVSNQALQRELIQTGKGRLQTLETAKSRAVKYIDLCETLANLKER